MRAPMWQRIQIGDFEIDPTTRRLQRLGGEVVHLSNRPFKVLLHLIAHRERLVTRTELLDLFWDGRDVYEDALTRCLSTVRKALGDRDGSPRYIETRWAEGYRFIGPCRQMAQARLARRAQPSLVEHLMQCGNSYLCSSGHRSHRYALEMFRQASVIDPGDARAHGGLAASHALLYLHAEPTPEHRAAAIRSSRTALELDVHCPQTQLGRALVALLRADHAEAHAAFRRAEELDPAQFFNWYYHGRGRVECSDHDGALENFLRAAEANPDDYQVHALAEQSFRRLGLRADALRAARTCASAADRALQRDPADVRALSLAACVLPLLNRKAEARGWTERAVALEPSEPFVNFNAACVYLSLRDHEQAIHYLKRVPLSAQGNYNWLAHDPCLDPVRSHPRFASLLPAPA